jgi:penicillin-binding protein 1A
MMNKVVEEGTAKRAMLDGIKAAGKTGTTNAHRDAWFVGFTGNFICGVWFGNDDYTTMHQMTGGSLPAMTWHTVMAYAHQGVELKPIPGLGDKPAARVPVAEGKKEAVPEISAGRPSVLTRRGTDALLRVERMMDDATRALAARGEPPRSPDAKPPDAKATDTRAPDVKASSGQERRQEAVASATDNPPDAKLRGN